MNIRAARVGDVPSIQELIRTFADRKLMIRRSLGELYESIREFIVATDDEGRVIGCAALHVFWEDLAELKCLAVAETAGMRDQWLSAARHCVIASIGPTASETLREAGLPADIEPEHPKMGHLVQAVAREARAVLEKKRGA